MEHMSVLAGLEQLAETAAKEISHDTIAQDSYKITNDKIWMGEEITCIDKDELGTKELKKKKMSHAFL